jgi:hypothetical protein
MRGETHDDDRRQPWRQGPESSAGALTGEKRESVGLEGGWNRLQALKLGYRVKRTDGHVRALGHDYSMAADLVQISRERDTTGYLIG